MNKIRSALGSSPQRPGRSEHRTSHSAADTATDTATGSTTRPVPAARPGTETRSGLRRLRIAITAFFALDGFVFAGWVVRIPEIKHQTGASPSALGLALLGVSVGGVVTMMITGGLCRRFGNHPVTVAAGVLLSLSVALPPLTHSAPALGLVLLIFGAGYGGVNVAMNAAAVDLIAALRRPVMPSFHAAFSLGGMAGAGLGVLVNGELTPLRHLLTITALGLLVSAVAGPVLLSHAPPRPALPQGASASTVPSASSGSSRGSPAAPVRGLSDGHVRRLVLVLGLIALCTSYGEGALADWSALHLTSDLHASAGVAAAGYSVFALAMALGRMSGTALLERLGESRALIAGGVTACAGMLLGALGPVVWPVLVGFVITGFGLANSFPVVIGRAGALAGPSGVAAASTLGYGGMLLGPVAIGFLADWFSLTAALTTVAALAGVAATVAWATRRAVLTESRT